MRTVTNGTHPALKGYSGGGYLCDASRRYRYSEDCSQEWCINKCTAIAGCRFVQYSVVHRDCWLSSDWCESKVLPPTSDFTWSVQEMRTVLRPHLDVPEVVNKNVTLVKHSAHCSSRHTLTKHVSLPECIALCDKTEGCNYITYYFQPGDIYCQSSTNCGEDQIGSTSDVRYSVYGGDDQEHTMHVEN